MRIRDTYRRHRGAHGSGLKRIRIRGIFDHVLVLTRPVKPPLALDQGHRYPRVGDARTTANDRRLAKGVGKTQPRTKVIIVIQIRLPVIAEPRKECKRRCETPVVLYEECQL